MFIIKDGFLICKRPFFILEKAEFSAARLNVALPVTSIGLITENNAQEHNPQVRIDFYSAEVYHSVKSDGSIRELFSLP